MWRDYSIRYIKINKSTSIFLAAAALISSTLLSLVSGVFYNLWVDYVNREIIKTGSGPKGVSPMIFAYTFIMAAACAALISMIHNAFEVSMNARIHQLGILKSVGATPKQIRSFLMQEAFILCALPIISGVLFGILLTYGFMELILSVTALTRDSLEINYTPEFVYHIVVAMGALLLSAATVYISAWLPAKKISRLTPLTAIFYGDDQRVPKMKHFRIFSKLFGVEGELARKSIYARRKSLRTASISLGLSFLALSGFLNMETISHMYTQETYYERYKDVWDIIVATDEREGRQLETIRSIKGVLSCAAYRKIDAYANVSESMFSKELLNIGGLKSLSSEISVDNKGNFTINVPIIVLDEKSFHQYLNSQGIRDKDSISAVFVNRIWDSINSDRLNRVFLPFLNESGGLPELFQKEGKTRIRVNLPSESIAFAKTAPVLREEYSNYALVQVVSEDFYKNHIEKNLSVDEQYYNILLNSENEIKQVIDQLDIRLKDMAGYQLESRQEKEISNARIRGGLKFIIGCLAVLLSAVGLANVFSSTLGQVYQRRKEFARYLSVGISPKGIKKILRMEMLIISVRPVFWGLVINIPLVILALNASLQPFSLFLKYMPVLPILTFTIFIILFISLAYFLGWRKICSDNIIDILRDETDV